MEELMALGTYEGCSDILSAFSNAHRMGYQATKDHARSKDHAASYAGLVERAIPLLGKLQHFRDQGEAMCDLSNILRFLKRKSEAASWYQRARDVGAAHGLFSLESRACKGLGMAAMEEGRHEEGVALLRNALVAAELNELDDPGYELEALSSLINSLLTIESIDEAEPLVLRYREAAKAQPEKEGGCFAEFHSSLFSARLHEVLCMHPAFGNSSPQLCSCFQHGRIASDCHRLHRA
jgi:tetratricopeptide (TPR) repeat protein